MPLLVVLVSGCCALAPSLYLKGQNKKHNRLLSAFWVVEQGLPGLFENSHPCHNNSNSRLFILMETKRLLQDDWITAINVQPSFLRSLWNSLGKVVENRLQKRGRNESILTAVTSLAPCSFFFPFYTFLVWEAFRGWRLQSVRSIFTSIPSTIKHLQCVVKPRHVFKRHSLKSESLSVLIDDFKNCWLMF